MEVLALIPARGGSKGVPRKNVRPLAGKPLLVYTLEHALAAKSVTRTIVSTDDDEIASIAVAAGAEVPFRRPSDMAQDESTDLDVFRHALRWLSAEEGYEPDLVVHLRPTHPIREPGLIDRAVQAMVADPTADSLRSVSAPTQSPFKMWRLESLYLKPLLLVDGVREAHSHPRQSLPEVWSPNGSIDVIRPRTVLELDSIAGDHVLPLFLDDPGIDIDSEDDFQAADKALRARP